MKARRIISNIFVYLILIVMSVIWILPFVWLVFQAISQQTLGDATLAYLFPQGHLSVNEKYLVNLGFVNESDIVKGHFTFQNFIDIFTNKIYKGVETKVVDVTISQSGTLTTVTEVTKVVRAKSAFNYLKMFSTTLISAIFTAIFSTLFALCSSYAFSRLRFKARKGMMKVILILGMFPGFLTLIVVYQVLKLFNLQATIFGLVLCYIGGAGMNYYVLKGFFDTISKSVDEAAMIDGANKLQIFAKITMPLSKPIIVYTILTAFMGPWGDYVTASYIMGSKVSNYTLAVGLYKMTNGILYPGYWLHFCAGSVVIAIPIAVLFLCLQKYYVSGITGGAVKG